MNRLKEDDEACLAALQNGRIFLFHRLSPLLQRTERGTLKPSALITSGTDHQNQEETHRYRTPEPRQPWVWNHRIVGKEHQKKEEKYR